MSTISINQMDLILARIKGAKIAGLTTATATKMNKTNGEKGADKRSNPFHDAVTSIRNISAMFCYDYDGNVGRAREKAGQDPEGWRKGQSWMKAITDAEGRMTAFCEHKDNGTKYVRLRTLRKGDTTYVAHSRIVDGDTVYEPGDTIPFDALKPFWPKSKSYKNQGLEAGKEIQATTLKLASIRAVRIHGDEFKIAQDEKSEETLGEVLARFARDIPEINADEVNEDLAALA